MIMAIMGLSLLSVSYLSVLSQRSGHKIYPITVSRANHFLRSSGPGLSSAAASSTVVAELCVVVFSRVRASGYRRQAEARLPVLPSPTAHAGAWSVTTAAGWD